MKLALLFLLLPSAALADEPAKAEAAPTTVYAHKTFLDFSTMTVSGEVEAPKGAYVIVKKKAHFRTLIRVRGGFLPEIARSVDKL